MKTLLRSMSVRAVLNVDARGVAALTLLSVIDGRAATLILLRHDSADDDCAPHVMPLRDAAAAASWLSYMLTMFAAPCYATARCFAAALMLLFSETTILSLICYARLRYAVCFDVICHITLLPHAFTPCHMLFRQLL